MKSPRFRVKETAPGSGRYGIEYSYWLGWGQFFLGQGWSEPAWYSKWTTSSITDAWTQMKCIAKQKRKEQRALYEGEWYDGTDQVR